MARHPGYRGFRRTPNRQAVLGAAEELFAASGFAAVSIDDIVARAGVAKGTFYNHFCGKADIAQTIAEEIRADVRNRIGATKLISDDPAMHLALAILLFLDLALTRPKTGAILITMLADPTDSQAEMNARLLGTLSVGESLGRFLIRSNEAALVAVLGITAFGMRNLIERPQEKPRSHMCHIAAHALAAVGLAPGEAKEIASQAELAIRRRMETDVTGGYQRPD